MDLPRYDSYDLWAHTENHLERERISFPRRGNFYPSEASVVYKDQYGDETIEGGCLRKSWYRLKGYPGEQPNARAEMIFAMGRAVESFLREQWKEMGICVASNVEFFDESMGFPIKGELDTIMAEPPDGRLYTSEIKSFYGYYATKEIMGNRTEPGAPKLSQLLQTLVYTYLFRKKFYCARLVYMARDDPDNHRTFKVEVEPEGDLWYPKIDGVVNHDFAIEDMFNRYKDLAGYLEADQLPPRDYELDYSKDKIEEWFAKGKLSKAKHEEYRKGKRVGAWQCLYCPHLTTCYKK
jgi:CRISPR/Cas system-associated exonuclease Cas4 (RecB family)